MGAETYAHIIPLVRPSALALRVAHATHYSNVQAVGGSRPERRCGENGYRGAAPRFHGCRYGEGARHRRRVRRVQRRARNSVANARVLHHLDAGAQSLVREMDGRGGSGLVPHRAAADASRELQRAARWRQRADLFSRLAGALPRRELWRRHHSMGQPLRRGRALPGLASTPSAPLSQGAKKAAQDFFRALSFRGDPLPRRPLPSVLARS
mmetsp:Transcript_44489/g.123109  ORF Transcript_44489/g.123109 Transcript_44489/m.123109 type:complete len:210 (+) Transcript_44489:65-694(+)